MGKVQWRYSIPKLPKGHFLDGLPPPPMPIPIRIVNERASSPTESEDDEDSSSDPSPKFVDEFYPAWENFLSQETHRTRATSNAVKRIERVKQAVDKSAGQGLQSEINVTASYEQASTACKLEVAAIVKECRQLNQKYSDAGFNLDKDEFCIRSLNGHQPIGFISMNHPHWVKRVEEIYDDPKFFIDGPGTNAIKQGRVGNCWFIAGLMAIAAKQELIEKLCVARDEQAGVYGFVFFRDGEWIHEVIDDKLYLTVGDDDNISVVRDHNRSSKHLPQKIEYDDEKLKLALQKNGEALFFGRSKSNETWLPLIEKAYAKAHGDYVALDGGRPGNAMEDLTGGVSTLIISTDILDRERFWKEQLMQVNQKFLFAGAAECDDIKGILGDHVYAVLAAWEEGDLKLLKLRNPWGESEPMGSWSGSWSDGSKLWTAEMLAKLKHTFGQDGIFWMPYEDFLKHFRQITRVRLFDQQWSIASRWASVNVPWTPEYLDTEFHFSTAQSGPVILVLSKTDSKYFNDLRGRYDYSLRFLVCKVDESKTQWIVRSGNFSDGQNWDRSVSAEIEDLDAGSYKVIFEVTAKRSRPHTAQDAIYRAAIDRRAKLLSVGRRLDYAKSKGDLRALEMANMKQRARDVVEAQKGMCKKERKYRKEARQRESRRIQRMNDAMREQLEALERRRWQRGKKHAEWDADRRSQRKSHKGRHVGSDYFLDVESNVMNSLPQSACSPPDARQTNEKTRLREFKDDDTRSRDEKPGQIVSATEGEPGSTTSENGASASSTAKTLLESTVTPEETSYEEHQTEPTSGKTPQPLSEIGAESPATRPDEVVPRESQTSSAVLNPATSHQLPPPFDRDFEFESPILEPAVKVDDDFDWDSDLDGPFVLDDDDDDDDSFERFDKGLNPQRDIFGTDPWNATCVLGLRIYSKEANLKVTLVEGAQT